MILLWLTVRVRLVHVWHCSLLALCARSVRRCLLGSMSAFPALTAALVPSLPRSATAGAQEGGADGLGAVGRRRRDGAAPGAHEGERRSAGRDVYSRARACLRMFVSHALCGSLLASARHVPSLCRRSCSAQRMATLGLAPTLCSFPLTSLLRSVLADGGYLNLEQLFELHARGGDTLGRDVVLRIHRQLVWRLAAFVVFPAKAVKIAFAAWCLALL